MKNTKKTAVLSLLTALSLIIFLIESMIPALVPIPGIKLGLANIITLFVLSRYSGKEAACVLFARIVLASIFAGQMMSFFYSLAGGVLCLIMMIIIWKASCKKYIWFTSVIGAVSHNIGQILVAFIVLGSSYVFAYLPFLLVSGVITGIFTGLCAYFMNRYIPDKML